MIHDMDSIVMLIGITYRCCNGHKVLSYDPIIQALFEDDNVIPFVLSHKSGFTKQIMRTTLGLIEQGIDFTKVTSLIRNCRTSHICILQKQQTKVSLLLSEKLMEEVKSIIKTSPSRFILTSAFLQQFFSSREEAMTSHMRLLSSEGSITIDHTFKVAANIRYFRSDKKWTTQNNPVFIVLNELGQVLTWKFTKTETY